MLVAVWEHAVPGYCVAVTPDIYTGHHAETHKQTHTKPPDRSLIGIRVPIT